MPSASTSLSRRTPSVFRPSRSPRSMSIVGMRRKGREDQAADLAVRVSLGVDVDIPIARLKLPSLIWGQGRLPVDRTFHGTPLFGQPDHHGSIFAWLAGAVEVSHGGWTREAAIGNRPGHDSSGWVVRQVGGAGAGGKHWWHFLAARERHLERYGCSVHRPWPSSPGGESHGHCERSPRQRVIHVCFLTRRFGPAAFAPPGWWAGVNDRGALSGKGSAGKTPCGAA